MRWVLLVLGALGLAVAFLPLAAVLGRVAPGLEAQAISGTIWDGRLRGASYNGVALGDLDVGLDARRLVRGEASLGFTRLSPRLSGRASGNRAERRLQELNGELLVQILAQPVPAAAIRFDDARITASPAGACLAAGGQVSARLSGIPLIGDTPALSGQPRCDGTALFVPLGHPRSEVSLDLWLEANGRWRAGLRCSSRNPLVVAGLAGLGFRPMNGGMTFVVEGRLGSAA